MDFCIFIISIFLEIHILGVPEFLDIGILAILKISES